MTTCDPASLPTCRDVPPDTDLPERPGLPGGTVAGQFQLMEPIGRGAFGTVYRGIHPLIGKEVAVKVLDCTESDEKLPVQRFIAEAQAINRIRHPNVVAIYDFGEFASGQKFYVMELLRGETLAAALKRGKIALAESVRILESLAGALDAAHAAGILHRDIKPSNVFLHREDDGTTTVKLLDFGVAKILVADATVSDSALGTPAYMAPEQHGNAPLSAAADIYAFGVLAYELLTGTRPFKAKSALEVIRLHLLAEPAPASSLEPSLPAALNVPLAAMLRKDAAARPATATAAVQALRLALTGAPSRVLDDLPTLLAPAAYPDSAGRGSAVDETTLEASSLSIAHEDEAPRARRLVGIAAGCVLAAAGALLLLGAWWRAWSGSSASIQAYAARSVEPPIGVVAPPRALEPGVAVAEQAPSPPSSATAESERRASTQSAPVRRAKVARSPSLGGAHTKAAQAPLSPPAGATAKTSRGASGELEF